MVAVVLSVVSAALVSQRPAAPFVPGTWAVTPGMVNSGTPSLVPPSTDCAIRKLALEHGQALMPGKRGFRTLYDALQLGACGVPVPSESDAWMPPRAHREPSPRALHVNPSEPVAGKGMATGALHHPFVTVAAAIEASRSMVKPLDILLRGGTHFVGGAALQLGPQDSGLRLANFPGEAAVLSGGISLAPQWAPSPACGAGCFEAALPSVAAIAGLRRDGVREIRARWPNFDEELDSVDDRGVLHVHNGRDGWVTTDTNWSMNGTDMNGIAGPWPPADNPFELHVMGADDWPGIEWPMQEMLNTSNGTLVPTDDKWTGEGDWGEFWHGTGGTCVDRSPPVGYWCADSAPRGISPANHPGGIFAEAQRGFRYKNPAGAIVHAWMHAHWYTYMFEVRRSVAMPGTAKPAQVFPGTNAVFGQCPTPTSCVDGIKLVGRNASTLESCQALAKGGHYQSFAYFHLEFPQPAYKGLCFGLSAQLIAAPRAQAGVDSGSFAYGGDTMLEFSRGGFQGGEGADASRINTQNWYIENVFEEIDSPREWFFNESTRTLYYQPNATAVNATTGLPTGDFVATGAKVLINITGTQDQPVQNITITGLTFRDASYTYMDPHGLPSGGDWALQKQGAITLVGTESAKLDGNLFTRLDGNAIFMGGYHRGLEITDNEFEFIGDSAMASWGETSGRLNANGSVTLPYPVGPDGRGGNQNRGATVTGNIAREIGLWQKQSSMWFQAVTAGTQFHGNVAFNMPRAAFNYNDGFGGGDHLSNNLLINTCRESGDHGPWNSWNRVPYITTERTGKPSIIPKDVHIERNFFLGNYNAISAIDTDDGSSYIKVHDNVLGYATAGLKSDFGGHHEVYSNNLLAYVHDCIMNGMNSDARPGHQIGYNDGFWNNSCVFTGTYQSDCFTNAAQPPTGRGWDVHDNKVFSADGQTRVCARPQMNLSDWVAQGHDHGSTSAKWPTDDHLVGWAKAILGIKAA